MQFYRNILTYKIYKTTNIRHLMLQVEKKIVKFLKWQSNIIQLAQILVFQVFICMSDGGPCGGQRLVELSIEAINVVTVDGNMFTITDNFYVL